jgi:hypothetical protein
LLLPFFSDASFGVRCFFAVRVGGGMGRFEATEGAGDFRGEIADARLAKALETAGLTTSMMLGTAHGWLTTSPAVRLGSLQPAGGGGG